jgi:hypothetical protein
VAAGELEAREPGGDHVDVDRPHPGRVGHREREVARVVGGQHECRRGLGRARPHADRLATVEVRVPVDVLAAQHLGVEDSELLGVGLEHRGAGHHLVARAGHPVPAVA